MSLINDVLKDLERRQGDTPIRPSRAAATTTRRAPMPRWPIWLIMAVAAGVALHWSLEPLDDGQERPDRLPASMASEPGDRSGQPSRSESERPLPADTNRQAMADPPMPFERLKAGPDRPVPDNEGAIRKSPPNARASATTDRQAQPEVQAPAPQQAAPGGGRGEAAASRRADESEGAEDPVPQVSIQRARPGDDRLDKARRAFADDRTGVAEMHLREVIDRRPHSTEAFELLATILIQRQRPSEADSLLERGIESADHPDRLALLLGRLRLERGETARAIEVLRQHAPEMAGGADHHLLLALAHRQAGDHAAAAEVYRRLSEVAPGRARVWLGLGVSLEALERFDEATTAYRRAAGGDDVQAARFARQRLAAIERRNGGS